MTASETLPLRAHRAGLERYLSEMDYTFTSVAGEIIRERLPMRFARDPMRPCLLLWACAANGGDVRDALPVAAAFDLFDRFMHLHDELTEASAQTVARWGLGQSLNAGDALYALAFRALASEVADPRRRLEAARLVGEAVLEAIEGQSSDVSRRSRMTAAALAAGAVIAGAPESTRRTFARAGRMLGAAAQIADEPRADRLARRAVAAVARCTSPENRDAFEEVARYVARRAA